MKKQLTLLFLAACLGLNAAVCNAESERRESCESVTNLLLNGGSAADVVRAVRLTGMSLAEATVYAMVCGGEANRTAIARAGIEMADNLAQAQSVAYALLATAGKTGPVADTVRVAMDDFARLMGQPDVYQDEFTPLGGGVSPAA